MAKVTNNVIMHGMSGKIGDLVFRTRKGKTFVSRAPSRERSKPATEAQIAQHNNFSRCVSWAQQAIKDQQLRDMYQRNAKGNKTAYNLAFSDAAHAPEVVGIFPVYANRKREKIIHVHATDNFCVAKVKVEIFHKKGELLMSGFAEFSSHFIWEFSLKGLKCRILSLRVVATAFDHPGNSRSLEKIL